MTKNEILTIVNTLASIVEGKTIDYTGTTQEKMECDIQAFLPKVVEKLEDLQASLRLEEFKRRTKGICNPPITYKQNLVPTYNMWDDDHGY